MLAYLIVVALLPATILGYNVNPCPGGLPAPSAIRIEGCPDSPCHVDQGGSVTYQVDFVSIGASDGMTFAINSTVFGEENEVYIPEPLRNGCNTLIVGSCPVTDGQALTQGTTLPVSTEHHGGIPAQLRVTMTNSANVINMCCLINIIIH